MALPDWLKQYADGLQAKRDKLLRTEQPLFDALWQRAIGQVKPALSGRERNVLISFLTR